MNCDSCGIDLFPANLTTCQTLGGAGAERYQNTGRAGLSTVTRALRQATGVLCAVLVAVSCSIAAGQENAEPTKSRLRIQEVEATPAVKKQAEGNASGATLSQVLEGVDTQLLNAIEQTRKFELVPRDLRAVLREQDFAQSGNLNPLDPQTAKAFKIAGVKYIGIVTVDNFQDITASMVLEGGLGKTKVERRTIQVQGVVKVIDATRATVLRSTSVRLEKTAIDQVMAGEEREGRATNALVGEIAKELAARAANEITDTIFPAKVIAYTLGSITFNRTAESGVTPGQIWEVFALGTALVDPETGESLGAEEIHIGWAKASEAGPKFSKAVAIEDSGIDRGHILRHRPEGLPAGVDPNVRPRGSASTPTAAPPGPHVPAPGAHAAIPQQDAPAAAPKPLRLAIFVKNRAKDVPDERVMYFEDQITASVTAKWIEVIRREEVVNAVARFAKEGPNAGTGLTEAEVTDRLLSDRTSASNLATNMGADAILIAAISAFDSTRRQYNDGTNATDIQEFTLRTTYSVLDGATGGSLTSGNADKSKSIRQTANLRVDENPINELLQDASRQVGDKLKAVIKDNEMRPPNPAPQEVMLEINIFLADFRVPQIARGDDGEFRLENAIIDVGVMNAEVHIDGMSVGSAPGTFRVRPGMQRLLISRPLLVPEERMVNVKPGLVLNIPMRMTDEGRQQWMEMARFFDGLKAQEVMREADLIKAEAFAEFLKNSGLKINLDTKDLAALGGVARSFWQKSKP